MVKKSNFKKVLVLGDSIIDVNSYSSKSGISAETPTLKGDFLHEEYSFGGAALVFRNLIELNSKSKIVSFVSKDKEGNLLKQFLLKNRSNFIESKKNSHVKKRYWIDQYKILQINKTTENIYEKSELTRLLNLFKKEIKNFSEIIISDYRTGLFSNELIIEINKIVQSNPKKNFYLDSQATSKTPNHYKFENFTSVIINNDEFKELKNKLNVNSSKDLLKRLNACSLIIKNGPNQIQMITNNEHFKIKPPKTIEVDSCGAGDAFIAAYSSFNGSSKERVNFAAKWASGKVGIIGPNPYNLKLFSKRYGLRYPIR